MAVPLQRSNPRHDVGRAPDPLPRYTSNRKPGKLEAMLRNQAENAEAAKRALLEFRPEKGAPSTRRTQCYVEQLWDFWYEELENQPRGRCPETEDIFRFIVNQIQNTTPIERGKPAISMSTMQSYLHALIQVLTIRYPAFHDQYGKRGYQMLSSLLDQQARSGSLIKGTWRQRTWLGFSGVMHIIRMWLFRALTEGCQSWDRIWTHACIVVVQMSCFARIGDITLSEGYDDDHCFKWKDVQMIVTQSDTPSVNHIRMWLVLRFVKEEKDTMNQDHTLYFEPLENRFGFVCPIRVLVVLAMRCGQLDVIEFSDLLAQTCTRRDRKIQWKHPDRPVFCSILKDGTPVLEKPAQCVRALQRMAREAGVLGKVTTHSIRRGAARDYAHAGNEVDIAVSDGQVASALHHGRSALGNGVTARYIGSRDIDMLTPRATSDYKDMRAPAMTADGYRSGITAVTDVDKYMDGNGMDKRDMNQRRRAAAAIRESRIAGWEQDQVAKRADSEMSMLPSCKGTPATPIGTGVILMPEDVISVEDVESTVDMRDGDDGEVECSFEDLDEMGDVDLEQRTIPQVDNVLVGPFDDFVRLFSRINVRRCDSHIRQYERNCASKNQAPQPIWTLYCGKCSAYSTHSTRAIHAHLQTCTGGKAPSTVECPYEGCDTKSISECGLSGHLQRVHKFQPRRCPRCSDSEKVYLTYNEMRNHMRSDHADDLDEPRKCPLLGDECKSRTPLWYKRRLLHAHLCQTHGMRSKDATELIGSKQPRAKRRCPFGESFGGCGITKEFPSSALLRLHIVRQHGKTLEEAEEMVPLSTKEKADEVKNPGKTGPRKCPVQECKSKSLFLPGRLRAHLIDVHHMSPADAAEIAPKMRDHAGRKAKECPLPTCKSTATTGARLRIHLQEEHGYSPEAALKVVGPSQNKQRQSG